MKHHSHFESSIFGLGLSLPFVTTTVEHFSIKGTNKMNKEIKIQHKIVCQRGVVKALKVGT